jgi:hypothetical protein
VLTLPLLRVLALSLMAYWHNAATSARPETTLFPVRQFSAAFCLFLKSAGFLPASLGIAGSALSTVATELRELCVLWEVTARYLFAYQAAATNMTTFAPPRWGNIPPSAVNKRVSEPALSTSSSASNSSEVEVLVVAQADRYNAAAIKAEQWLVRVLITHVTELGGLGSLLWRGLPLPRRIKD